MEKLKKIIDLEALNECYRSSDKVISVILIGSCSRDEEIVVDGRLLSDIEFFIIYDGKISKSEMNIVNERIDSFAKNNKIKIDYSYLPFSGLPKLKHRLIFLDTIKTGRVIYGLDNTISLFPKINEATLDVNDVDEIVLYRLLDILSEASTEEVKVSMLKNVMYLVTWALIKDGELPSTFSERYNKCKDNARKDRNCFSNQLLNSYIDLIEFSYLYRTEGTINTSKIDVLKLFKLYENVLIEMEKNSFTKSDHRYKIRMLKISIQHSPSLFFKVIKNDFRLKLCQYILGSINKKIESGRQCSGKYESYDKIIKRYR
ncbi:hypothetical protein AB4125_20665 [Vibrio splendidus]